MSKRRENNSIYSDHHLTPKSKGGKGKDKKRALHNKHVAWHILTGNSLPESADGKLSYWIPSNYQFFALNINNLYAGIKKINNWITENYRDDNFRLVIKVKRKSKIIKFQSYSTLLNQRNLSS